METGKLDDIIAIIESAKARGGQELLEKYVAQALPESDAAEVREAAEVATEVIESIPVFLARARMEAEERDLESVVNPILDRAEHYFVQPIDLIPEMTQGLPGLLDDSYLVICILQNLERGPHRFLDWDLDYPARFLQRLIGPRVSQQLDGIAKDAIDDVSNQLAELWNRIAHHA